MCYKFPGPRCSSHAYSALKKATRRYLEAKRGLNSSIERTRRERGDQAVEAEIHDLYCAARVAQDEFDATPRGQEYLKAKIERQGDANGHLKFRLEQGAARRAHALQALRSIDPKYSTDKGDVEEDNSRHDSDKNPTNKRQYINALEQRAKNLQTALRARMEAADLDVVGVAQEDLTDLTEAGAPQPTSKRTKARTSSVKKVVTMAARRIATPEPSCHGAPEISGSDPDCHGPRLRRGSRGYPAMPATPIQPPSCH